MNLNLVNVTVFAVGAILVYAGVKNVSPQDVVKSALGKPLAAPNGSSGTGTPGDGPAPSLPPSYGGIDPSQIPPHMSVDPAPSVYRQPLTMPKYPVVSV